MAAGQDISKLYEELAGQCHAENDSLQRDVFLVLAADSALVNGQAEQAERLRQRLLELSPYTLLRPFASFAQALESADIRDYVGDLRQQFPPETAVRLLSGPLNGVSAADFPEIFSTSSSLDIFPLGELPGVQGDTLRPASPEAVPRPMAPPVSSAPAPAGKQRRRSPYENPDYGPRIPTGPAAQEFVGTWIIYFLVGLVGLLALVVCGYVFVRPILQ